jgi:hypothetical protein
MHWLQHSMYVLATTFNNFLKLYFFTVLIKEKKFERKKYLQPGRRGVLGHRAVGPAAEASSSANEFAKFRPPDQICSPKQVPFMPNTVFPNFTHICKIFLQICLKFITNLSKMNPTNFV